MEQIGEPLRIQVSDFMKNLIVSYYPNDYKLALRGEVKVKVNQLGILYTF